MLRANSQRYLDPHVLQRLGPLELVARQVVEGLRVGHHTSPLRGFSTEFAHHRPYAAGDAVRHIDWRVYGRTQRYFIKLYDAETNFDVYLLLDASSSMRYGSGEITKLDYAKMMAASLAYLTVQQRDSVGLGVFDSELRSFVPPSSTQGVIMTIVQKLEEAEPVPRTDVAAILHEFAQRIERRSFIMVFSDMFAPEDEVIKGLGHLAFGNHNVSVFHILDPQELDLSFTGTCRFVGLEGEGDITTQPARIAASYKREVEAFTRGLRRACERHHADYTLVNTTQPLEVVLTEYLLRRKQLAGAGPRAAR